VRRGAVQRAGGVVLALNILACPYSTVFFSNFFN
jgi:hypothetical protein